MILQLAAATAMPVLITALFTVLERKTSFHSLKYMTSQILIGLMFGAFAILSTAYGVPASYDAVINVRDAAPLCAGLIFGGPAGIIAGSVGAVYRWLCVYWGGGMYTRLACSTATFLAGILSALMRRQLFEGRSPNFLAALGIGTTMEVMHMLLVLVTNLNDVSYAFMFVEECSFPMILCNGIALSCAVIVNRISPDRRRDEHDLKARRISYDFAFWLFVCVIIAFFATSTFTQQIVYRITTDDAALYRHVTLYMVTFMEVMIYTALFILIYQMLKKKVIFNLQHVNDGLKRITDGDLDTEIDVRAYREFSDLSDHVNETVDTLKHYIKEAEERIDKELEFARQIQRSALPSVFPPFPERHDFEIFASMDAAREVGGDFYDFYMPNSHTLVFLMADVSGKGIPAAMFMMNAKTLLKGLAESGRSVDAVFNEANATLCENNEAGMFITAWMGALDLRTGKLSFVNAGHNPPLICRRNGSFEYLRTKPNFILAGMEMTKYRLQEVQLMPGDEIYLYTDGVTEAADINNELYGEERLEKTLAGLSGEAPEKICKLVKADVDVFAGEAQQADDITMLCMRLNAFSDKNSVTVIPDEKSIPLVIDFIGERLRSEGVPAKTYNRVQVVLDEIYSNIVHYSGAEKASVSFKHVRDKLMLTFTDNGKQFDPTAADDPDITLSAEERGIGGLGILMVRKMSASNEYEYADGMNKFTVVFDIEE